MKKYFCVNCGYIYDESEGDPERGIARGSSVSMFPEDWCCPDCGAGIERLCEPRVCIHATVETEKLGDRDF